MTETTWGSDAREQPRPKKGIPAWAWACGTGCLLAMIVGAIAAVLIGREVQKASDPDRQWARVDQVLPVERRPKDIEIIGIPFSIGGMQTWTFEDERRDLVGALFHVTGENAEEYRGQMLDPERNQIDFGSWAGNYGRHEVESATVTVQGRELEALRFQTFPAEGGTGKADTDEDRSPGFLKRAMGGATVLVDLTPPDSTGVVLFQLTRQGSTQRVTDEELREFLDPFRVGPERSPEEAEPPVGEPGRNEAAGEQEDL